jgi:Fe-S-cluster-containing dehydrogenase component/CRP-like cAMP-binding protein
MAELEIAVPRPQRWDEPFGEMTDADIDALLRTGPFCRIDATAFPATLPLRGILRGDTRVVRFESGDLVVREGDYGHSAFLVLAGTVRVVLERLDPKLLGRDEPPRRTWRQALAQLWQNSRLPEVRRAVGPVGQAFQPDGTDSSQAGKPDPRVGARQDGNTTRVCLQDVPRLLEHTGTVRLGVGEIFGELAALTRTQRTATVLADGPATLLEIRWQGLRDLMRRTPAIREHVEQLYRQNSLRVHLRETPLLADLPAEALERVAAATVFESYGNFDWYTDFNAPKKGTGPFLATREEAIDPATAKMDQSPFSLAAEPLIAAEGDRPTGLLLVRSGFARVSRRHGHGHQTVAYLGKGQVFGFAELAAGDDAVWRHSLRAVGYVDVLRIPVDVVREVIVPHCAKKGTGPFLTSTVESTSPNLAKMDQSPFSPRLLDFLADHRFLNGTRTMLINLDRCTRCDDCVRACAATHDNNPRFIRQGAKHGNLMVAGACMHCVDPVCMIGCPTGAIGRDELAGTVRINDRTCIGCATCANSCPYEAIRMVEIRDPAGAMLIDQATQQPIQKATKCDYCAGQLTGPACQHACPHDALVRVDMSDLSGVAAWLAR